MNVNLNELIAALPQDDSPGDTREELQRIFADLSMRPTPTGSLQRMWTLGELSVQVALAYGVHRVRGWFSDADAQERRKLETNLRLALKIVHRLGYMRGALMKAGQAVASFPQILPTEIVNTIEGLHFDAPPMHYSLIREVLANELGAEPEEVFQSFERQAFAAASIGQVHRAILKTGEQVAVKIQYPGIARTIDADIRNVVALMLPLRLGKNWDGLRATVEEIHTVLKEEADYEREAESLRMAHRLFDEADGIVVPHVFDEYSGRRVLTMEYLPGLHMRDYLATKPSAESRNAYGTRLCFSWYRLQAADMHYGDPHSGNYLFMEDGKLGLLDFGCVQRDRGLEVYHSLYELNLNEPDLGLRAMLALGANPEELTNEAYLTIVGESLRWLREPLEHVGHFDYGNPDYLNRRLEWFSRASDHSHAMREDPELVYFTRSSLALTALLYELRAKVDVRAMPFREWWGD